MSAMWVAFASLAAERERQDVKWGSQRQLLDDVWNRILGEEVGEVAKALNDVPLEDLRAELVQVAAVCVAWIEALDYRLESTRG